MLTYADKAGVAGGADIPRRAHARDAYSAYASEPPPPPAAASKVALVRVTLGLDYAAAGDEGSEERELFLRDLTTDLGAAAGLPSACFEIMRLMPGSIVGVCFCTSTTTKKKKLDCSPPKKILTPAWLNQAGVCVRTFVLVADCVVSHML
jgi:hypothetical protein